MGKDQKNAFENLNLWSQANGNYTTWFSIFWPNRSILGLLCEFCLRMKEIKINMRLLILDLHSNF